MGHPRLSASRPAARDGTLTAALPPHGFGRRDEQPPADVITCAQVHGGRVLFVAGEPPALSGPEGDAIVTDRPGVALGVRTADCLPILLLADGGRAVAAVHAGWRGTLVAVAPAAVRTLTARYGVAPETVTALLGPCIRACCYEVGPEVGQAVRARFPGWARDVLGGRRRDRERLDLPALNRRQLEAAGVADVRDAGGCTCCDGAAFFSYRREGPGAGRMVSWIRAGRPAPPPP